MPDLAGFVRADIVTAHQSAWDDRWHASDIEIGGDPAAQQAIRFAAYHMNSAANPDDPYVSVGARALTGADYRGHVFWDTEIFLLPFYTMTWPAAARSLLMYRFHTLKGARAKARGMGFRGAMYAWESADTGFETTPEQVETEEHRIVDVLTGKQEQHISADIAYAVWQYWLMTNDEAFLRDAGAEILLETARFWSSRAVGEADGQCHIRGVIGPDEYHEHVDDNAYTNVMARWNIRRGLDAAALLRERWPDRWAELSASLDLTDREMADWRDTAGRLAVHFDPATGLFEQFEGYFGLEDIDVTAYPERKMPFDVLFGRERTQGSQLVKQADVVALAALLPEEFPAGSAAANYRYYEPRCGHGSSLSPAMHGLVAARLGDPDTALRYFRETASIDLAAEARAAGRGVHMAALGGLWMLVVSGFAGVSAGGDYLAIDPKLPAAWDRIAFRVEWRGRRFRIVATCDTAEVVLESGEQTMVAVRGTLYAAVPGETIRVAIAVPASLNALQR
jgi:trehalose/maltose hydrolase-like predicted phosphorylase